MKRILHLGDLHLSEYATLGGALVMDAAGQNVCLSDTLRAVVAVADAAQPLDGVIIAGDLFDRPVPTPNEVAVAVRICGALAKRCAAGVVIVTDGNHDKSGNPRRLSALADLQPARHVVRYLDGREPIIEYAGAVWGILPYPHKKAIREVLGEEALAKLSPGERNAALSEALDAVAQGMRLEIPKGRAPLLVYHGTIEGAVVGEQPRAITGDVQLSATEARRWAGVLAGHIHQQQCIPASEAFFCGSPRILSFGELADPSKGGLLWTLEDDGTPRDVAPVRAPGRAWTVIENPWDVVRGTAPLLADGTVYSVRGEVDQNDLPAIRDALSTATARGAIVQDRVRVRAAERLVVGRLADDGHAYTDRELVALALGSRAVPTATPEEAAREAREQAEILALYDEIVSGAGYGKAGSGSAAPGAAGHGAAG